MGVVLDNVDSIWTEGKMVMEIWSGGKLLYQYDNIAPELTIDIAGTSSKSPTYVQSDSVLDYTVTGTVSDADSGVKSVTVNGVAAEIAEDGSWSATLADLATNTTHQITVVAEDNAGNINTVNRYLRIEAYYQQAARVAGTTVQSSLDDTLKNSAVCTAIAGNSTAYGIMKSKYSSNMTTVIDSAWNDGLNLLNYRCKLKFFVYRKGELCSNISGGWTYQVSSNSGGALYLVPTSNQYTAMCRTTNKINTSGYSKVFGIITEACGNGTYIGLSDTGIFEDTRFNVKLNATTTGTHNVSISSYQGNYYVMCRSWGTNAKITDVYLTP